MNYVGISSGFHDASISIVNYRGDVVFAGHNERYSKTKHDKHINSSLVKDGLSYIDDDFEIHYYERPWLKYLRQLRAGEKPNLLTLSPKNCLSNGAIQTLGKRKYHTHNHHLSHAAAGFQTSSFVDATVVIIDSIGEFDTVTIWDARYNHDGKAIYKKLWGKSYPDSIGLFYSAMTKRIGLQPLDEEYILMGMSAHGNTIHYSDLHSMLLEESSNLDFKQNLHIGVDDDFLRNATKENIAASTQLLLEHLLQNVMLKARILGSSQNLVYGGGVALNCVANRLLGEYFDKIHILPNPGDSGSSLGAACLGYGYKVNFNTAYLGYNIAGDYPVDDIMDNLLSNRIVGVANGRAEFGPRSLGNRSLLADPRGFDIKDKVNDIKRRQKFRPFAPVILEEYVDSYFIMPRGWRNSRYMQVVSTCRHPELFPAIVHIDGTSRVQTVPKDGSGIRRLLEKWYMKTNCPMLLNTSLNINGEPMVNDRHDADRFEMLYGVKVLS